MYLTQLLQTNGLLHADFVEGVSRTEATYHLVQEITQGSDVDLVEE